MMRILIWALAMVMIIAPARAETPSPQDPDWQTAAAWRTVLERAMTDPKNGGISDRRTFAGLYLAMFSAGNAADPRFEPVLNDLPAVDSPADAAAALAGARFIEAVTGNDEASAPLLEEAMAGLPVENRMTLTAFADAVVEATRDRINQTVGEREYWKPDTRPGQYTPTEIPVTFDALHLQPFALPKRESLRPAGPPALDSDTYAKDWDEVRRLGGAGSDTERSAEQTARPCSGIPCGRPTCWSL